MVCIMHACIPARRRGRLVEQPRLRPKFRCLPWKTTNLAPSALELTFHLRTRAPHLFFVFHENLLMFFSLCTNIACNGDSFLVRRRLRNVKRCIMMCVCECVTCDTGHVRSTLHVHFSILRELTILSSTPLENAWENAEGNSRVTISVDSPIFSLISIGTVVLTHNARGHAGLGCACSRLHSGSAGSTFDAPCRAAHYGAWLPSPFRRSRGHVFTHACGGAAGRGARHHSPPRNGGS